MTCAATEEASSATAARPPAASTFLAGCTRHRPAGRRTARMPAARQRRCLGESRYTFESRRYTLLSCVGTTVLVPLCQCGLSNVRIGATVGTIPGTGGGAERGCGLGQAERRAERAAVASGRWSGGGAVSESVSESAGRRWIRRSYYTVPPAPMSSIIIHSPLISCAASLGRSLRSALAITPDRAIGAYSHCTVETHKTRVRSLRDQHEIHGSCASFACHRPARCTRPKSYT